MSSRSEVKRPQVMSASRMREKMAARNGPRHSVYWVQAKKPSEGRLATFTDVMESSNMAASAPKVEYKVVGKYTGNWRDGKKHGYGSLVYSNGSKYEGEWRDGERHGRGVYWVEEGKKLRKQYAGEWEHDKRHGVGTFFYQNGARFEGLWVHNKREGSGRMEYADDQGVYEGEWLGNQRSGRGSLTLANGDRYDGYWLHDKKEGPGRFYYKETRKMYEGEWVDGAPKCGTYRDLAADEDSNDEDSADGSSAPSRYIFQLPELELARPEQIVSETVANIRQDRVREMTLNSALAGGDDERAVEGVEEQEELATESVIFDDATLELIQREFDAVLDDEASGDGRIPCSALPRLLDAIQLFVSPEHLEDFMEEIGATSATRVSFAECVDILSLLAETAAVGDEYADEGEEDA